MDPEDLERRLAAILSADVVGYGRLMAEDEVATLRSLTAHRDEIRQLVERHRGRVVDAPGDNVLAEFRAASEAVRCAAEIQRGVAARSASLPPDRRMQFRIGVHLGEVMVEGERIYGDGVNIAARLESLAEPGGICISASVHEQVQSRLDLGYEDLGAQSIKNLPRPVRVYRVRLDATGGEARKPTGWGGSRSKIAAASIAALVVLVAAGIWLSRSESVLLPSGLSGPPVNPPLPDKPSIVVLPFSNLSDDPEQEYFTDGISEDLTTHLAGLPDLFVIARNTASTYKGKTVDVEDIGRALGVRYVLEGSVRRVEDRVRITAQLIDAASGFHLFAEGYDRELTDIFALQAEVVEAILAALRVEIRQAEIERIARKPTESLTAYDAVTKGRSHLFRTNREDNLRARSLFERALELDPEYARAYAQIAITYSRVVGLGWDLDPKNLDRAEAFAKRSLELDPFEPRAHFALALILRLRGRTAESIAAAERAIELSPNLAEAHFALGMGQLQAGDFEEAVRTLGHAMRLDPQPPPAFLWLLALAHDRAGQTERTVELMEGLRAAYPELLGVRLRLADHYERSGRLEDARAVVQEILRVMPDYTTDLAVQYLPSLGVDPEEIARRRASLRRAGLPDRVDRRAD